MAGQCEACGSDPAIEENPLETMWVEVAGVGGHCLCVGCLRELNLAAELMNVRAEEAAATLMNQVLVRRYATTAPMDALEKLKEGSAAAIRATIEHYRASVRWIRKKRAAREAA